MTEKIASFDIMDTCLIRKCGRPSDLFDVLSYHAFFEEVDDNTRMAFILSRIDADNNLAKEDKTIDDIYEHLTFTHPYLRPKHELIRREIELEYEMMLPVQKTLTTISNYRQEGFRIVFVSDMYLPTAFFKSVLTEFGFLDEKDSLYISCDIGCTKSSGGLFDYIAKEEHIKFHDWIHYGDNPISDIAVPKKKGIKTRRIELEYSPFQQKWLLNDYDTQFRYTSIMAGLGRAIMQSRSNDKHTLFAVDIIAPLIVPFVCNILHDATNRGITDLYFFSRDAYSAYQVGDSLTRFFNGIRVHYLYISQEALYSEDDQIKLKYFIQEGLASYSQRNAIVDIRSTGKSLSYINKLLNSSGNYNPVFGYLLNIFCDGKKTHNETCYYSEYNYAYCKYTPNGKFANIFNHWGIYEMFFSIHTTPRTIGYCSAKDKIQPIFSNEKTTVDCIVDDAEQIQNQHIQILRIYAEYFMQLGLFRFSHDIIKSITTPTLGQLFKYPHKQYLETLCCLKIWNENLGTYSPYVEKKNILHFLSSKEKKKMIWPTGSLVYSLPSFLPPEVIVRLFIRK